MFFSGGSDAKAKIHPRRRCDVHARARAGSTTHGRVRDADCWHLDGLVLNLALCTSSGPDQNCGIGGTGNSVLSFGDVLPFPQVPGMQDPSTLTAVPVAINSATNVAGLTLAALDWRNRVTLTEFADDPDLTATYNLNLAFTQPIGGDTASWNLAIDQTFIGVDDIAISIGSNPLFFTLPGITVSNLRFAIAPGSREWFTGGVWTSGPELGDTSRLLLLGDFIDATAIP